MKIEINHGKIIGIKNQELNPVLPTEDLSYVTNKDLYKEIRNYIKSDHRNLKNELTFSGGVMKQSNTYLTIAIDMFLKKHMPEYRIATQKNLETDLQKFKGHYIDTGLALRNLENTNKDKAQYIFDQLKTRGIKVEDFPIWLNLRGLELDKDINIKLTDESVYSTENSLNWESGTKYSKVNDLGLPREKDSNSNRQIWTSDNALSGCHLYINSDLDSGSSDLSVSGDYGRVVLAKPRSG